MSASGEAVNEAEVEDEVLRLAAEASRAYLLFVGAVSRAQNAAALAEAGGVKGVRRFLPAVVARLNPNGRDFLAGVNEPVARGLIDPDEANRLLGGRTDAGSEPLREGEWQ